ncbi:hypothetical protein [uncultured Shewanella sp.]|uniref:hypothetical protein n=1 Tax=uncultured Shewanella sp. TaxID=173975 RepID=UPI00260395BE|nr:hypothetical protein [uncultured Shewanella sp.]
MSAVMCILLMLSINAYACTEKMILPMVTDTVATTYAMPSADNTEAKTPLGDSHASAASESKPSLITHKNMTSDAPVSQIGHIGHIQKVEHKTVSQSHLNHIQKADQKTVSQIDHTQKVDHQPAFPFSSSLPVNRGETFIPLGTQAYLSFIQHDLVEIQPEYQLAFEFSPPVIPSFKVGYRIDANNPSWFLTTFSKSARVSGWKESNLIYRFTQQIS